ncbi:response regulator [Pelosinus sp. UFO1]|uniref:response regulator n=1 Tax=Pelosinus sp. UFO1 TaxID=484770 RepID=UPI0004D17485|nr:response regulator [Pelosinus sp. UFO1]AIF53502.1 response regulator receiver protein [Pelosinus sp. UFO1]
MTSKELHLLLVEDDAVDILNVQRSFRKMNLLNPMHVAYDGLEALALLRGTETAPPIPFPTLILLDINMPRMNGLEFLRELRSDQRLQHLSVVVFTTSDEEKDIIEAYNFHVAGYILKPVVPEKFFEVMIAIEKYWSLCENITS